MKNNKNKIIDYHKPGNVLEDKKIAENFLKLMLAEADEIEKEINNRPDLEDVNMEPGTFDKIVERLKREKLWEEDNPEIHNSICSHTNKLLKGKGEKIPGVVRKKQA